MTAGPDRSTVEGNAYLDLRKLATETERPTDQLIQLYGLEGFLHRLSRSPHATNFVLKGGVLLPAYTDRRPTRDIDFAADKIDGDLATIRNITNEILAVEVDDGLDFDPAATSVESIRDHELYPSIRAKVTARLSTAKVRFHIDVNIGDPLWPEPNEIELPRLLSDVPLQVRGYAVELILAEKIVTAIERGTVNTRWRDFLDIANLALVAVDDATLTESIRRVAAHRQATIQPLAVLLDGFAGDAQQRWSAWRRNQQLHQAPEAFSDLLDDVISFADPHLERLARSAD